MLKSAYNIEPHASYSEAGVCAIRHQVEELFRHLPGTRAGDDPEALHDMRVASRRLRAALSVFEDLFPAKEFRLIEKEVSRITDSLGTVRDADVQIEFIALHRDSAPESERVGLEFFLEHLSKSRNEERVRLVKAVDHLDKSRLREDFEMMLTALYQAAPSATECVQNGRTEPNQGG
jgi:CHAD domain-containing protein